MPILILILLALCPGLLIAVGHGLLLFFGMGAAIETKRALFGKSGAPAPMPTKFSEHPPAQLAVLAIVLIALAIAGSYAAYVVHSAS